MFPAGFPHSEIHGSRPAFGFPWLFADRCVLLRLPVPRHPPCALLDLTAPESSRSPVPSCSNHFRVFGKACLAVQQPLPLSPLRLAALRLYLLRFFIQFSRYGRLPLVQPLVGSNGLEPSTSRLSGVRSNHLSYEPMPMRTRKQTT